MLDNQWQPRSVTLSSSKSREVRLPVAPGTEPGVALAATEPQPPANGGVNLDAIMYLGLALASIVLVWTMTTTAAKD